MRLRSGIYHYTRYSYYLTDTGGKYNVTVVTPYCLRPAPRPFRLKRKTCESAL
jgi:hypothetical protein